MSWLTAMVVVSPRDLGGPFGEEGAYGRLWHWIPAGGFVVEAGFLVDNLTARC